ncbi:MAG: hypothetical protein ACYDGS_06070 [Thermoleophilia bacterium]
MPAQEGGKNRSVALVLNMMSTSGLKKNGALAVKGEEFKQKRSQISSESSYGMLENALWSYKGNNVTPVETYSQPFIG